MTNREVALAYLRCFCAADIDGLAPLLSTNLKFDGTLNQYRSSREYLNNLRSDPPEKCGCTVLSVTEDGDSVSIFYDYEKPESVVKIAQLFKIENQKISEILLIFDGRDFS